MPNLPTGGPGAIRRGQKQNGKAFSFEKKKANKFCLFGFGFSGGDSAK
jgi:hypothetical protein